MAEGVTRVALILCEPCSCDNLEVSAVSFCVNCTEYLCGDCTKGHRRNRVTRNHKTLDGDELPNDPTTFLLMKKLSHCSDHPETPMTFKCEDHKVFICTSCLAAKHRKCDHVSEIADLPEENDKSLDQESLDDRIVKLKEKTASSISSKEGNIETVRSDEKQIIQKQENVVQKMRQHFKGLLNKSKNETKVIATRGIKVLADNVETLKNLKLKEENKHDLLLTTKEYGTKTEYNIINEIVTEDVTKMESELGECCNVGEVKLKFEGNDLHKNIKSIGNVTINEQGKEQVTSKSEDKINSPFNNSSDAIEETDKSPSSQLMSTEMDKRDNTSEQPQLRRLLERQMNETALGYNIKSSSDKHPCKINGILIVGEDRILSDIQNENIKLFDKNFAHVHTMELGYCPNGIYKISSSRFAVICNKYKGISRFNIREKTIFFDGEFPTKFYPVSFSMLDDTKAGILFTKTPIDDDSGDCLIEVRNVNDGQVMTSIGNFLSIKGDTIKLHSPKHVLALKQKPGRILISGRNIIHSFKNQGSSLKELWFFKSNSVVNINNITDIDIDSEDNAYICCKNSFNVIQVSSKNFRKNRILSRVPTRPISMAIDENRGKIYICSEDSVFVRVYDFC